jgi:hypothetical protein
LKFHLTADVEKSEEPKTDDNDKDTAAAAASEPEQVVDDVVEDPSPSPSPSFVEDSYPELLSHISDEEKERLHQKKLLAIPTTDSGLSPICFTSEESLRIEELLRLDRESMIAFGDTLRERNRVIFRP